MIIEHVNPFMPKYMIQNGVKFNLYEHILGTGKVEINAGETKAIRVQCPYEKAFFTSVGFLSSIDFAEVNFHFEVSDGQGGYTSIYQHGEDVTVPKGYTAKGSSYEAEINENIFITVYVKNTNLASPEYFALNVTLHKAVEEAG